MAALSHAPRASRRQNGLTRRVESAAGKKRKIIQTGRGAAGGGQILGTKLGSMHGYGACTAVHERTSARNRLHARRATRSCLPRLSLPHPIISSCCFPDRRPGLRSAAARMVLSEWPPDRARKFIKRKSSRYFYRFGHDDYWRIFEQDPAVSERRTAERRRDRVTHPASFFGPAGRSLSSALLSHRSPYALTHSLSTRTRALNPAEPLTLAAAAAAALTKIAGRQQYLCFSLALFFRAPLTPPLTPQTSSHPL